MGMRFDDHAFSPGKTVYPLKEGRVIKKGELMTVMLIIGSIYLIRYENLSS